MTPGDARQPGKLKFKPGPSLLGALWAWLVARVRGKGVES
jgi:hypothetical protein